MLRWRLISAAVILAVLFTLLWLDYRLLFFGVPGAWLLPVWLTVALLATEELLSLLRAKNHRPIAWVVYLGNLALPLAAALPIFFQLSGRQMTANPLAWPLLALAAMVAFVFWAEMARYRAAGTSTLNASLAIFSLIYIGFLIGFWALLRLHIDNGWGMTALFSMLLIVKMADVGAYVAGKNFGQHKLTPVLSPGKTWEGALGGIAAAVITSWAFFHFAAPAIVGSTYVEPSISASIAYGVLLALAGLLGDLAESLLKRDMDRKDSSTWLPGLGGVLDIIDSVLMAGPVAWACWAFGMLGP